MRAGDVRDLPTTTTLRAEQVAELLGCSTWSLYEQVKAGTCPVEPIRLGRRLVWPTAKVLALLGLDRAAPDDHRPAAELRSLPS